ncbi:MAG: quinol:electron acceptor oxidoreductase subunit ActD [Caldilineaceae bacterium]
MTRRLSLISAYSPFHWRNCPHAIGIRPSRLPGCWCCCGVAGALGGFFFLQYYAAVLDYPWNIGGCLLNSWPSFIIVTFEMTISFASGAAALGMILRNGCRTLSRRLQCSALQVGFCRIASSLRAGTQFDLKKTQRFEWGWGRSMWWRLKVGSGGVEEWRSGGERG